MEFVNAAAASARGMPAANGGRLGANAQTRGCRKVHESPCPPSGAKPYGAHPFTAASSIKHSGEETDRAAESRSGASPREENECKRIPARRSGWDRVHNRGEGALILRISSLRWINFKSTRCPLREVGPSLRG